MESYMERTSFTFYVFYYARPQTSALSSQLSDSQLSAAQLSDSRLASLILSSLISHLISHLSSLILSSLISMVATCNCNHRP